MFHPASTTGFTSWQQVSDEQRILFTCTKPMAPLNPSGYVSPISGLPLHDMLHILENMSPSVVSKCTILVMFNQVSSLSSGVNVYLLPGKIRWSRYFSPIILLFIYSP